MSSAMLAMDASFSGPSRVIKSYDMHSTPHTENKGGGMNECEDVSTSPIYVVVPHVPR